MTKKRCNKKNLGSGFASASKRLKKKSWKKSLYKDVILIQWLATGGSRARSGPPDHFANGLYEEEKKSIWWNWWNYQLYLLQLQLRQSRCSSLRCALILSIKPSISGTLVSSNHLIVRLLLEFCMVEFLKFHNAATWEVDQYLRLFDCALKQKGKKMSFGKT